MLNVAAGGSLYQDLPTQLGTTVPHLQKDKEAYSSPIHCVTLLPSTLLHRRLGVDSLMVNSIHHQGISKLGEGLIASATSEDGLIEAVEHPGKRLALGVQWHPEFMWRESQQAQDIFSLLVDAANGKIPE